MANKMLIDASHPEETRVVVLRGNRVEEFDFESASKKQLRGNIYLAKVTRVEPSLQAAFIEYGGNRHGFLAFSEIHPDYYQIPVADRQALLEEEARQHRAEDEEESQPPQQQQQQARRNRRRRNRSSERRAAPTEAVSEAAPAHERDGEAGFTAEAGASDFAAPEAEVQAAATAQTEGGASDAEHAAPLHHPETLATDPEGYALVQSDDEDEGENDAEGTVHAAPAEAHQKAPEEEEDDEDEDEDGEEVEEEHVEHVGGDHLEEVIARAPRLRRQYKIQEVIKRRQVLLVQVVKEERGNKGAALTTYLSLAGRYSVLMPNTARGGGISRKITDNDDRKRLKAIASELEVPEGMGVILRTAGASRTKQEVRRDFEYLLRMWETVREITLKSSAPMLVYEEGSLIKRAIRDLYNKDVEEILVAGDEGYAEARDFMRMLMPTATKSVVAYRDPQPIFARYGVEAQLDSMFSNQVTLKSGGYLVINQTEALVAIDVNSGRSTREHYIEDTALRTNLEAADEVARQLRLRDLAGLIVVDFIDMEENRNNRSVERRLKDALKNDRARIQVGRISHFGLLEMSRQRIRTGVFEGSTVICPHCAGAGFVRSTASIALHVLRVLEDALIKSAAHNIIVRTRTAVALYILNQKRQHLGELEERFGVSISVAADDTFEGTIYHSLERGELAVPPRLERRPDLVRVDSIPPAELEEEEEEVLEDEDEENGATEAEAEAGDEEREGETESEGQRRRRRRRRRRGRGADRESSGIEANAPQPSDDALSVFTGTDFPAPGEGPVSDGDVDEDEAEAEGGEEIGEGATGEGAAGDAEIRRRRRRSRRGGRNRGRDEATAEGSDEGSDRGPGAWVRSQDESAGAEAEQAVSPVAEWPSAPSAVVEQAEAVATAPVVPEAVTEAAAPVPMPVPVPEPEPILAPVAEAPAEREPAKAAEPIAAPVVVATAPEPVAVPEEPRLPDLPEAPAPSEKRTGWWARAKQSLGGA